MTKEKEKILSEQERNFIASDIAEAMKIEITELWDCLPDSDIELLKFYEEICEAVSL